MTSGDGRHALFPAAIAIDEHEFDAGRLPERRCPGSNPPGPANDTKDHTTNSSLGSGWISRQYHACVPGYDPSAYP
jgi:hypothetical protein